MYITHTHTHASVGSSTAALSWLRASAWLWCWRVNLGPAEVLSSLDQVFMKDRDEQDE